MANSERLSKLRGKFADLGVEAMVISNACNRHYISGFTGTACTLLISAEHQILATDPRYTEQAAGESPGWDIRDISRTPNWLAKFANELGIRRLGVEADDLTVSHYEHMLAKLEGTGCELVRTDGVVAQMRIAKDDVELDQLQDAIRIGDEAFMAATMDLAPGISERELAIKYLIAAREMGASDISFSTIVASGPNAARPHHQPTSRKVEEGETIVFDCGVIYQGYCSDLTRTLVIGEAPPKVREVYSVVLEAQLKGIDAVKAGIRGSDADKVARAVIERAGYGDNFGHGLGHGVGLQVHEEPYLSRTGDKVLEAGATVTVEPGIYLPGWGGVRIEDVVLVEENGARLLSKAPKLNL